MRKPAEVRRTYSLHPDSCMDALKLLLEKKATGRLPSPDGRDARRIEDACANPKYTRT